MVQNEEYLMVTDLEIIRRLYEGGIQIKFYLVFHRILKKKIEGGRGRRGALQFSGFDSNMRIEMKHRI